MDILIDMQNAPKTVHAYEVEAGNVYMNQRGSIVLIVAVRGSTAYYLTFALDGTCIASGQAGTHYYQGKRLFGRTVLPKLSIEWESDPLSGVSLV